MLKRLLAKFHVLVHNLRGPSDNHPEGDHYFIDSGYITTGRNYEKHSENARQLNRKDGLVHMRELIHAHTLLLGVIGKMLKVNANKPALIMNEVISRRFVLTAAFIQGISLCEQSILQGLYLQAGNLIRQEYETLGLLAETKAGKRKDGKVGNAKHVPRNGDKLYGMLSSFAHLSDHKILDSIIGYNTTWGDFASTVPQYQKENAARLYSFHTTEVLGIVEELQNLYGEIYGYKPDDRESEVVDVAYSVLVKHGVFKIPN